MLACTTNDYDLLYARWLRGSGDIGTLLRFAGMRPGADVLDLCGGTGAVAAQALAWGANSVAVFDLNPRVRSYMLPLIRTIKGDVNKGHLYGISQQKYDLVVCRQALGYLDLKILARDVPTILKPGGKFVFNMFKRPKWKFEHYRYEGHHYWEASAVLGRTVWHLQSMIGLMDVSKFRWHTAEDVRSKLHPRFCCGTEEETEKSIRYCLSGK
jgi:SAM-dependent methyltransferase